MKLIKKILSLMLIILSVFNVSVLAADNADQTLTEQWMSDLDYYDMIDKYDFIEKIERDDGTGEVIIEEQEEVITNRQAVNTVLALDIMSMLDDGTFSQDNTVAHNEFAKIIMNLAIGEIESFSLLYDDYGETAPITQSQALEYLVKVCGYEIYQTKYNGDSPWNYVAKEIGLLKGLEFNAEKLVTRGELAQLIYNALLTDMLQQVTYGESPDYEVVSGKTLLKERYDAVEVEGVLTAISGSNLFSEAVPRKNEVEINRVRYKVSAIPTAKYYGHMVAGIAQLNNNNDYELIVLDCHEDDETVEFFFDDIVEFNDKKIIYADRTSNKSLSVNSSTRFIHNGEYVSDFEFTDDILGMDGFVTYIPSWSNNNYSIVMINSYSTFTVSRISAYEKKIYLAHNAVFEGNRYIDAEESVNSNVVIFKNGNEILVEDIKSGDIISVIKNDKGYTEIRVSDQIIEGSIKQKSDDKIMVGGNWYAVSNGYYNSKITDSTLVNLELNVTGRFYLTFSKSIADFDSDAGEYSYGYMRTVGKTGTGLNVKTAIRVLNAKGQWQTLTLADKLNLDGVNGTKFDDAYTILTENADVAMYGIIRYKLNGDDEVDFLDTLMETEYEEGDPERIKKEATWSGSLNWTSIFVPHFLDNSKYWFDDSSLLFCIPTDKDKEEKYEVVSALTYDMEVKANFLLYSGNNIGKIPVAESYSNSGTTKIESFSPAILVSNKALGINEDDDQTWLISGFFSDNTAVQKKELFLSKKLYDEITEGIRTDISVGDVVHILESDGEIIEYKILQTGSKVYDGLTDDRAIALTDHWFEALGTVSEIIPELGEPARANLGLVKIDVSAEEGITDWVFGAYVAIVYDSERNTVYSCPLSEIYEGDRAFFRGHARYMNMYVYR